MTLITGEAFDNLFTSIRATADRLEVRDRYRSDVEDEVVRRFVAGEPDDMAWATPWLDKIRALTAEGKQVRRVRVVTLPLSDYQRCGVLATAPLNVEAGEDVRYLDRARAEGLPDVDYWLFDAGTPTARAAKIYFDERDCFLGAEIITGDEVSGLSSAFLQAFGRALPPESFAEAHGLR